MVFPDAIKGLRGTFKKFNSLLNFHKLFKNIIDQWRDLGGKK